MTQEKIDLNLNSLVAFLTARGTEASLPTIRRLTEKGVEIAARLKADPATVDKMLTTQKITDADWRDMLYYRQAGILTGSVKELKTFLGDPDAYPRYKWAHIVLHLVYEIMASSSILARRCVDDELADQLLNRERKRAEVRNAFQEGVSDKTQPRNKTILELAKERRFLHPREKRGTVASEVFKDTRLTDSEEWKAKPMGLGGVDAVVRKHWSQLSPSLPRRTGRR